MNISVLHGLTLKVVVRPRLSCTGVKLTVPGQNRGQGEQGECPSPETFLKNKGEKN